MLFRFRSDGALVDHHAIWSRLSSLVPQELTPELLEEHGIDLVTETDKPAALLGHDQIYHAVQRENGNWLQAWSYLPWNQERKREEAKKRRAAAVDEIIVTVDGMAFDGNEVAQLRMLSCIITSDTTGITEAIWTLADNTEVLVNISQLRQAHALAVQAMGAAWPIEQWMDI